MAVLATPSVLQCGAPQGSVLGPLLFTLYTHPLGTVIYQSGLLYNFFADDSQLHKSSVPFDFPVLACLKVCIEDIAEWMSDSELKMNDDKTELMAIWHQIQIKPNHLQPYPYVHLCLYIPFSQPVRNFCFYLDETLSHGCIY